MNYCNVETKFHIYEHARVTCRDWFQLSLKEGLTVFRDQVAIHFLLEWEPYICYVFSKNLLNPMSIFQEFSSDLGSRPVKRIADVSKLRTYQFPQVLQSFLVAVLHSLSCFIGMHIFSKFGYSWLPLHFILILQDAGPMAHPVRPHSYIKVSNTPILQNLLFYMCVRY